MSSVIRPNGAAKETTSLPVAGWGEETDDISDYSIYDRPRMVCCPDNWISFENDSELTYDIIWQTLALHLRLRCLVSHNWSANTSVNASRRKWHFFYFLRRRLVDRLVFYFHFARNLRRPWGRGWITRVALSCVTAVALYCIYAGSRLHTENKDPRDSWDTFNAVFLFCNL